MMGRGFRLFRFIARALAIPAIMVLYGAGHLLYFGFPEPFRNSVIKSADSIGFSLEMSAMRLDFRDGVVLHNVKMFKKGTIGRPDFEASELAIAFDVSGRGKALAQRIKSLKITGGRLAPEFSLPRPAGGRQDRQRQPAPPVAIRLIVRQFDLQDLWVEDYSSDLRIADGRMRLGNIDALLGMGPGSGNLRGSIGVDFETGEYDGDLVMVMDPNHLLRHLDWRHISGLTRVIRSFKFPSLVPRIQARFSGKSGPVLNLTLDGKVFSRHLLRNNTPVDRAEALVFLRFDENQRLVILDPLLIHRAEGDATVAFTVDSILDTVEFRGKATVDPEAAAELVVPGGSSWLSEVSFNGPAKYSIAGKVNITNQAACRIAADIECAQMIFRGVCADQCSLHYDRNGTQIAISQLDAAVLGGGLKGSAQFEPASGSTNTAWRVNLTAENMKLKSLAEQLFTDQETRMDSKGDCSGMLELRGITGAGMESATSGRGELKIRNGSIFRLPLFGGLPGVLEGIIPGIDHYLLRPLVEQNSADVSFVVENGKARARDVRIEGQIFSLKADGGYDLATRQMDFDVELRFLKRKTLIGGVMQTIMLPVTKLFRIRLRGSPDKPEWESVNF